MDTSEQMPRPIRIGVQVAPDDTPNYRSWRAAVCRAEELGADYIFGYDHFHKPTFTPFTDWNAQTLAAEQPDVANFEGWTALASWGEITNRAEIGLLVTGIGYRNPDLLADMARTIDHISGGRLILGLGAGWYEKDYITYGYEYGTVASRFDLLDDGLQRIENRLTALNPPPLRKIPILIGGSGTKRTLPAVARHADIWHTHLDIDGFVTASSTLDELADRVGRAGNAIERSVTWRSAAFVDAYVDAGATTFITEVHPNPLKGYDFSALEDMLAWRDQSR
jgi:probable F420-dependent oxidoreductase